MKITPPHKHTHTHTQQAHCCTWTTKWSTKNAPNHLPQYAHSAAPGRLRFFVAPIGLQPRDVLQRSDWSTSGKPPSLVTSHFPSRRAHAPTISHSSPVGLFAAMNFHDHCNAVSWQRYILPPTHQQKDFVILTLKTVAQIAAISCIMQLQNHTERMMHNCQTSVTFRGSSRAVWKYVCKRKNKIEFSNYMCIVFRLIGKSYSL